MRENEQTTCLEAFHMCRASTQGGGYRSGTKGFDCYQKWEKRAGLDFWLLLYLALRTGVAAHEKKALAKGYQMRKRCCRKYGKVRTTAVKS